ncbi:ketopantoate reductase PanE/ApbA C terminal-domain-containing protein [Podospora fimiseda]|uniref:Ketopantoate reductase PanE/ApbA C terminal-domain-containing protein n=1 Tax=Podospora fimiseda TaxID=252190 RepID=A0AAN7H5T4_9PEZI|nr:ketopantoate reductase PanE/ApbA C terminal-domain-containing protein [Podospora fimiseda]
MGMDPIGRYITHALAGCESLPPPTYMMHSYQIRKGWDRVGRRLMLYDGDKMIARDRIKGVNTLDTNYELENSNNVIKNLIVTVPAAHVLRVLKPFVHRLDHRSTICLVNDGLGVAEDLIETYFPSIFKRPTFLLGHFTPKLGYTDDSYSVEKIRDGRLYLTLFQETITDPLVRNRFKRHPPIERTQAAQHLLRLLTAVPDLYASGHPTQDFFRYKLPTVAFHAIVDPLTVLLDCTYDKLPRNAYARLLMDQMLGEICSVVSRMWECKNSQKFQQFMTTTKLRDEVWHKLMRRRTSSSRMRTEAVRGRDTDIDYQSGYFVRRGRAQGLAMYTMDTVIYEVKGKQEVAKARKDIRKARLAQLKAQGAGSAGKVPGGGGGGGQEQQARQ